MDGEEEMEEFDASELSEWYHSGGADLFCLNYRVFAESQVWEGRT